jgi:hypothetical protein
VDGVDTGKTTPMSISLSVTPAGGTPHTVVVAIPNSGWLPATSLVTIDSGNNDLSVTLLPALTVGPPGPKGDKGDKGDPGAGATRAAGPCFDSTNRYVDCGNGTVTDTVTGLIWLKQWDCLPNSIWVTANQAAAVLKDGACGLTDNSSSGDWRLPTKAEWEATIARAVALGCVFGMHGAPSLTNDAGTACYGSGTGSSFTGLSQQAFWSSSSYEDAPDNALSLDLNGGFRVGPKGASSTPRAWPVRGLIR